MNIRKLNWPIWLGLLVSILAFLSYPLFFVRFPVTRDFPWVNLSLFLLAIVLLVIGLRRGFSRDSRLGSKIGASIGTLLTLAVVGLFVFVVFVMSRDLPASQGAPHIGQKAPEFTLSDTTGKQVALSELLSTPINGKQPKGVLMIFYRGYW
jgi:flagellar biosynthesis component FlhA